jgi:hypothetical protein
MVTSKCPTTYFSLSLAYIFDKTVMDLAQPIFIYLSLAKLQLHPHGQFQQSFMLIAGVVGFTWQGWQ